MNNALGWISLFCFFLDASDVVQSHRVDVSKSDGENSLMDMPKINSATVNRV